jgi:hypothetical protein
MRKSADLLGHKISYFTIWICIYIQFQRPYNDWNNDQFRGIIKALMIWVVEMEFTCTDSSHDGVKDTELSSG